MRFFTKTTITNLILLGLLTILSIVSFSYYFSTGLNFAYNDATSHLNIARRVVDSLTPGVVQIGSTWLPMLHLLEIPFVWNDYLWQTGMAGGFVSMICFVLSGYFSYKTLRLFTDDQVASWLGVAVFVTNANMLYLQTTAMFEPLLVCTMIGAVYFLLRWHLQEDAPSLLFSAIFLFLAVLTRYDGWILMASSVLGLILLCIKRKKYSFIESRVILYVVPPAFGLFLWLLYNLLIFGNPLYFAFNEYSAHAQQSELFDKGLLLTKGNPILAAITYSEAAMLNIGLVISGVTVIGVLLFLANIRSRKFIVPLIFLSPYAFNILALYLGHSVIWIPNLPPYLKTFFNVRYGILCIGAAVFFSGYLASKHAILKGFVALAIIAQTILFYSLLPGRTEHLSFVTLRDTVASINTPTQQATKWLRENYKGGLILISSASSESFIFNTGIHMNKYITEGTGNYYKESLVKPSKYANYVVFFPSYTDRVGKKVYNLPDLKKNFDIVYENKTYRIYARKNVRDISGVEADIARRSSIIPYSYNRHTDYARFTNVLPEDYTLISFFQ